MITSKELRNIFKQHFSINSADYTRLDVTVNPCNTAYVKITNPSSRISTLDFNQPVLYNTVCENAVVQTKWNQKSLQVIITDRSSQKPLPVRATWNQKQLQYTTHDVSNRYKLTQLYRSIITAAGVSSGDYFKSQTKLIDGATHIFLQNYQGALTPNEVRDNILKDYPTFTIHSRMSTHGSLIITMGEVVDNRKALLSELKSLFADKFDGMLQLTAKKIQDIKTGYTATFDNPSMIPINKIINSVKEGIRGIDVTGYDKGNRVVLKLTTTA